MKKSSLVVPVLFGALLTAFSAHAASTTDLKVIGNIVPAACDAVFGNGNVINYGDISAKSLSATSYTPLDEKKVTMTLSCEASTLMAISLEDMRSPSRVAGIIGSNDDHNFGLGSHKGANVGGFTVSLYANPSIDGVRRNNLRSKNRTKWDLLSSRTELAHTMQFISFGSLDNPEPFKTVTAEFGVKAMLNKSTALPITEKIPLDGLVQVTLTYL